MERYLEKRKEVFAEAWEGHPHLDEFIQQYHAVMEEAQESPCPKCQHPLSEHGEVGWQGKSKMVCPGDMFIRSEDSKPPIWAMSPEEFAKYFEIAPNTGD